MTSSSFLIRYGAEPTPDEFTVHYEPGSIGLGLTTEENVPGVSVLTVAEGSHSQQDGRIKQGQRIMAVNGVDISNVTQEEAVEAIKAATEGGPLGPARAGCMRRPPSERSGVEQW